MARAKGERVAMVHPTGRFTVHVSESRATTLAGRGYTRHTETTESGSIDRRALVERAKAVGVPAKGTNEALLSAVEAAEAAAAETSEA